MYNGIGLNTPRGSGTNGYVVRNLSFVRPPQSDRKLESLNDLKAPGPAMKQPNKDILLHDRKRKIEVQCMELRIKLEDDGVDADAIEAKVQELRQSLISTFEDVQPRDAKTLQDFETHQRSAAKELENKKMMRALRIDSDYVEGAAFDHELQEKKRLERIAKRQADEEARQKNLEKRNSRRHSRSRSPRRRTSRRDDDRDDRRGRDHDRRSQPERRRRYRSHTPSRSRSPASSEASSSSSRSPSRSRSPPRRRR